MFIRAPYNAKYPIVLDMLAETARTFGAGPVYVDGLPHGPRNCGAGIHPAADLPAAANLHLFLSAVGVDIAEVVWPQGDSWVLAVGGDEAGQDRIGTHHLRVAIPTPRGFPLWSPVALGIALSEIQKKGAGLKPRRLAGGKQD